MPSNFGENMKGIRRDTRARVQTRLILALESTGSIGVICGGPIPARRSLTSLLEKP